MKEFHEFREKILQNPEIKAAYDALKPEYEIIGQLIQARMELNLTQAELAAKIGTSQSCIARLEGGNSNPSLAFLRRIAAGLGKELAVTLH